jgi:hypothetical protein
VIFVAALGHLAPQSASNASAAFSACSGVRASWEEMSKYGNGKVFLNFTGRADETLQSGTTAMYGPNARRLGRIKAAYDPTNLFQLNNNIVPTA